MSTVRQLMGQNKLKLQKPMKPIQHFPKKTLPPHPKLFPPPAPPTKKHHLEDPNRFMDDDTLFRQQSVKAAFLHSWNGYEEFAWGFDELRPVTQKPFDWLKQGLTIVDSLDTLWIMDLKDEFLKARNWVANANFIPNQGVSIFETIIRSVGGLLSAYQLSGDIIFLEKLTPLVKALQCAYDNPQNIPYAHCDLRSKKCQNPAWAKKGSILAEIGTIQLEYLTFSVETGDDQYKNRALRVYDKIRSQTPFLKNGLYNVYISPITGEFDLKSPVSLGALGDSFFEYVLKLSLIYGDENPEERDKYREWFGEIIHDINENLLSYSTPSGLTYLAERGSLGQRVHKMDHLACFSGGMYGMASVTETDPVLATKFMQIAENITETCHEMNIRMKTGIAPEFVMFDLNNDFSPGASHYLLRPEVVESYFYMWRLTHNPKYRDWGWDFFQALEQYCKVDTGGYSGLRNVNQLPAMKDDAMPSYFFAETFKYLYLLFSPEDLISLDEYVFNTEAHPLEKLTKQG